jgi:hypothetical protein
MSTVRRGPLPTDNYTIVSNDWTRDTRLSWETRGFLSWLAGHAPDHQFTEADMIEAGPAGPGRRGGGRDSVRRMIRELEACGYLHRERSYNVSGGSTVDYALTNPGEAPTETAATADGSTGGRAEQGELFPAGEVFAGQATDLPADGSTGARSYTEDQKKTKTPSVSSATRRNATRVPEDFYPNEAMKAWFMAENLHRVLEAKREHEKFMDHFRAAPGERGRKLDWPATWRNWMRSAGERATRYGYARPVSAPPSPGGSMTPYGTSPMGGAYRPSTTDQRVAQGLALAAHFSQEENQ